MNTGDDIKQDVIELCRIVGLEVVEDAFGGRQTMVFGPLDSVAILIEALMYPNQVIDMSIIEPPTLDLSNTFDGDVI